MLGAFWTPFLSGGIGLLGVIVGGLITSHSQKRERLQRFAGEQIGEFYGPMHALRAIIQAKRAAREIVTDASSRAHAEYVAGWRALPADIALEQREERSGDFLRVLDVNNKQEAEEFTDSYRQMMSLFISKFHLAERSTRDHFISLVRFVEIRDRYLKGTLTPEAIGKLDSTDEGLQRFYTNVGDEFESLQKKLKEQRRTL